ncbi:MAG TPA: hypothetical protein VJL34_10605 [Anaerolineales bacterium]|nr:hypothetical protein [Anaerolineales bacterium]
MENDPEELEPATPEKAEPKPALVINIHTWATPVVGVVMLLVGLAGGYFGRPLISGGEQAEAVTTRSTAPGAQEDPVAATTSPEEQASRQEMMDFVVSQTRHFQGDPEATVTMVEFGDFQ